MPGCCCTAPGCGAPLVCGSAPYNLSAAPLPQNGPIAYTCADGTQLMVDVENGSARVAVIGGPSMVLPNAGDGYYSNGRYGVRGAGANVQWEVGRAAPVSCRGS